MCRAEECGLAPLPGKVGEHPGRVWKVMDKRVRKTVSTQGLEGELKLHMWMRYDWAK